MQTKVCSSCRVRKNIKDFYFRNRKKDIRHIQCKPCLKTYKDAHYRNNRTKYCKRAAIRRRRVRRELNIKLISYLAKHSCVDCGESDLLVLDFDHKNPETKRMSIGMMRQLQYSWKTIRQEIGKCVVRCANCHRRRTAKQFKWYKAR